MNHFNDEEHFSKPVYRPRARTIGTVLAVYTIFSILALGIASIWLALT